MTSSLKKQSYKLLFLCHEFPPIGGGAATALQNLTKELAQAGHEVIVLTIGPIIPPDYIKVPNLSVLSLGNIRKNLLCISPLELIRSYFLLKFKAPIYIDRLKPDVVTSFFAFPAGRAICKYLKKRDIPHIVSIRGVDAPGFHEMRLGKFAKHLIPFLVRPALYASSVVYANGRRLKDLVEKYFTDIEVHNIPNGVSSPASSKSIKKDLSTYNLIFVGQLIERKRVIESLEGVIHFAKNTHRKIIFTIVGSGLLEKQLIKKTKELPPNLTVILKGHMHREKLFNLYNKQHVMLQLSQDEGISNTLLEAFSKKLAVLASIDAVYEFSDQATFPGRILSSYSSKDIAEGLENIFSNENTLKRHFLNSLNLAKKFTWENNASLFLKLVKKVLISKKNVSKR